MIRFQKILFLILSLLLVLPVVAADKKQKEKKNSAKETEKSSSMPDVGVEKEGLTVFYGNSFVERQLEEGTLEALLQAVNAGKNLRFRSLAYTGDEVGFQIRPEKFGDHLGYITSQLPCERVIMCFGMNESFAGAEGLEDFKKALELNLKIIEDRHPGAKYVLVSPTAVEDMAGDNFPDATKRNEEISLYSNAIWEIAKKRGIEFVDLFSPSKELYAQTDQKLTSNGLHLNDAGNKAIAKLLAAALSDPEKVALIQTNSPGFESLRKLVARKNYEMEMAYKPANGIHYYGVRGRPYEYAAEIPHHLKLAITLDDSIWSQASDLTTAHPTPELPTAEAEPPNNKPRKGLGVLQSPEEDMKGFEIADGFEVNLFASSEEFPELINPLQIQFDTKGRLWVVSFSSYPVPVPGTLANDKVLIFEDTDGDGKADKKTVFADGLKLPDGFVFYKNGIILSVARQLVFLADTDGDDVADVKQELLRGVDDTDTHHSGYLARTPQGKIILNEGLFHRGQLETPYGVVRSRDAATFLFDADTEELTIERQPSHPNPWKITFNRWGESMQMFGGGHIIDCDFYNVSTPPGVSSASDMQLAFRHDKGIALSYVTGTQFPKEWMGSTVSGHLLAMNAVLYTPLKIENGTQVEAGKPVNLLSSKNKVFRPTDLEFGLDGALYVSDFYYPIIGHAQHSIRDENRDYMHGRIWRVVYKANPLSQAPQIDGADLKSLFTLFTHPQVQVRELVRLELEKRLAAEVLTYANSMIEQGMKDEEFGLELLWLYERNKDFSHPELFRSLVKSDSLPIKRAAARSLRWWAPTLGEEAKTLATELLKTDDDRTKIAIVSAASYLLQKDEFWKNLINGMEPAAGTPLEVVVNLAKMYDRPALSPEFPILKLSDDTKLTNLLMDKDGNSGAVYLNAPEATSLILSYVGNPYMNLDVNGIPMHRAAGTQHTKGGQINLTLKPGLNVITFFSAVNGKPQGGRIDLRLSDPTGQKPTSVVFAKDKEEHEQWAKSYEDEFATVTDKHIYIKTIPAAMEFNVKTFTVKAGKKYNFIFENLDHMQHNFVITQPGQEAAVGELADAMAADADAMERHYTPETDLILFATPQLNYEAKVTMEFTTPSEPGKYPFICTFPGHWRLMKGVMIVE
ncbi:MAG: GDSL-type esterase/lipase family protein [Luteolibacter sp.]